MQPSLFDNIDTIPFPECEQPKFTFIDLFAGIGGFRIAMQHVGGKCVFSSEWEPQAQKTYLANFGEMPYGDITKREVKDKIPAHFDVLCAGFPCQPFSISGKKKGFEDTRGTLFFDICQIISEHNPKVVFLENVKHLVHHDGGKTLKTILSKLTDLGYNASWKVLNGVDFGVPQNRERIIIIGVKDGSFNFDALKPMPRPRLKDFLDKNGDFEYLAQNEYTLLEQTHPQNGSGLIFAGYRNKSTRKAGVRPGTEHLSRAHKQPNRIYSVEGTHPTLPSQETSGRFFILTEDKRVRKLTIQECWRIMGFPDEYIKVSVVGQQYKQIGNSVCVKMMEAIASEIYLQILNTPKFHEQQTYNHREILQQAYDSAFGEIAAGDLSTPLSQDIKQRLEYMVDNSEKNTAVYTVFLTLASHKIVDPNQDIRYHQAQLKDGFAARSKDTQFVTPFLRDNGFPAMSTTGWLTRSLEQPSPFDLNFPGKIRPQEAKTNFLQAVDSLQCKNADPKEFLKYMMKLLIVQRNNKTILVAKPHGLPIQSIIKLLERHFNYKYSSPGASRLPVLAIYAVYQCMMCEITRFTNKVLCPLESHTSADSKSGQIGDVQVNNSDGSAFEAVEIKHNIQITPDLIKIAYGKFMVHRTNRYYLLTTANMDSADWDSINNEITVIAKTHGCQVIVNGVYSSLKYYLRLLNAPSEFIDKYTELLKTDPSVKFEQQKAWNTLVSQP